MLEGVDDGGFAVEEGLWALRNAKDCKVRPAAADPGEETCLDWVRIVRADAGAWRIANLDPQDPNPMLLRAAPAAPPLYVAESAPSDGQARFFAVIQAHKPRHPPFRQLGVVVLDCTDLLDAAGQPPAGVRLEYKPDGGVSGCKAESFAALVEAAQRAAALRHKDLDHHQAIFVRP